MTKEKMGCCPEPGPAPCDREGCGGGMLEELEGCSMAPTKKLGCTDDEGAIFTPAGFTGGRHSGLRYMASPQCGPVPGTSRGMRRAEWISWTKGMGRRVDPVEPLEDRLKAAGLYEYALTEPTGEE